MNQQQMILALHRLYAQWEADAHSVDVQGKVTNEWMRGVLYGIGLSVKEAYKYIDVSVVHRQLGDK